MTLLLTPEELQAELTATPEPVLLDIRWQLSGRAGAGAQRAAYVAGHLPGARFVDLEADCTDATAEGQGRHPLPRPAVFQAAMRRVGVAADRSVVVYDGGHGLAAARLWWLLTDAGHPDVRVLDGGYAAWQAAGLPTEMGEPEVAAATTWVAAPGRRERAGLEDLEARQRAGAHVIDVRAPERYRGDSEPIDAVAGHIPGAVNVPIATVQHPDGTLRAASEVLHAFAAAPGDVFSCGSGITASLALLAYEASGGTGAMIYPGSWSQWSAAGMPVETGEPGRGEGEPDIPSTSAG